MVDEGRLASNITKAQLTRERAVRDNKARNQKQQAVRMGINQGVGAPPPEPRTMGGAGYGDDLRRVKADAQQQSADMALSDMIRRRRGL